MYTQYTTHTHKHTHTHTQTYTHTNIHNTHTNIHNTRIVHTYIHTSVFDMLIWRTIGPQSFLFGTAQFSLWASGAVNYDYIVTNSINS